MILRGTIAAIEASGIVPAPPVFTTAPSITGTENVGQDLTLSLGAVDSGTITGTLKHGATVIVASVTDGQTYTLVDADDGAVLTLEAEATNADGTTTASDTTGTITYATPVAAGALADQLVQVNTGAQTVDASGDFTVSGDAGLFSVTWSLPTAPSGVTIDSDGIITIDTGATGLLDGSTVTVRATNSGGSADSGFSLTVADVPDAFADGDWSVDGAGDVEITALPSDNNDPLTDIEYRVNGGAAQSFGATTTGTYATGAAEGDDVEIRAVNSIGAGAWSDVKAVPLPAATGGTVTEITDLDDGLTYRVHTFTGDGTFEVNEAIDVEYLLVGGGGGGGARYGSGGGAGGLITNLGGTKLSLTAGSKTVTVGGKGLGGAPGTNDGTQGGDTVALGLTALGGGRGGTLISNGADGGSGSGQPKNGAATGLALQPGSTDGGLGHDGANRGLGGRSGGGGGAGSTPAVPDASGAHGGDGILSTITGTSEAYAGGGAGSSEETGDAKGLGGSGVGGDGDTIDHLSGGGDAAPNTGSGGGGGGDISLPGGDGADGIVIVRYRI